MESGELQLPPSNPPLISRPYASLAAFVDPTFANHHQTLPNKLRKKVARAPKKGGYGSLLIGRPQMMHFYFEIRLQNTSHRLSLHAHKCMVFIFLASVMCVIMKMLVMDYLVFFVSISLI